MAIPYLGEALTVFGLAVIVVLVSQTLRVPAIVGFLLTGILAGPHGLGLIRSIAETEVLAQIGVIFLLFTIGIEFSLENLIRVKRQALVGGSLQVGLTVLAGFGLSRLAGLDAPSSLMLGFLLSMTSTVIIGKMMQEKNETNSPHGQMVMGITIFHDMVSIPMMLVIPLLAGGSNAIADEIGLLLLKSFFVIVLTIVGARWLIPKIFFRIALTREREIFLLAIIFIALGVAWLTSAIGLSLALGAFVAGLIISESDYGQYALGNIMPFRNVFTSFFFISVGMLMDIRFFLDHPAELLLASALLMVIKFAFSVIPGLLLGLPLRNSVLVGLILAHIGEFSFVLAEAGRTSGLLTGNLYQLFLGVIIITMISAPFALKLEPGLTRLLGRLPALAKVKSAWPEPTKENSRELSDHLIIVGFGPSGRALAQTAKAAGIPYSILEINAETVRREAERGEPICFCDASQELALEHVGVRRARVMVVAITDPAAVTMTVASARRLNKHLHIIARTNFIKEVEPMLELGADEVIPAELEAAVEIFSRVLLKYLVPLSDIRRFVAEARSGNYRMIRSLGKESGGSADLSQNIPDLEIASVRVGPASELAGHTIGEVGLRKNFGVTIAAVRRESETIPDPGAHTEIRGGDLLVLMAKPERLAAVTEKIEGGVK